MIVSVTVDCPDFNPCCNPNCWSYFGDEMEVAISGVVECGCSRNDPGTGFRYWGFVSMTDINGVFILTAALPGDPSNTQWEGVIGVLTLQEFTAGAPVDPDTACTGTPIGDPVDFEITMIVNCLNGDPQSGLQIQTTGAPGNPIGIGPYFFAGDPTPNEVICDKDPGGYYNTPAGLGTITVSVP